MKKKNINKQDIYDVSDGFDESAEADGDDRDRDERSPAKKIFSAVVILIEVVIVAAILLGIAVVVLGEMDTFKQFLQKEGSVAEETLSASSLDPDDLNVPENPIDYDAIITWPVQPEYKMLVHDKYLVATGYSYIGDYIHNNNKRRLRHYVYITGQQHFGFDITARPNTPVVAAADGKVIRCATSGMLSDVGGTDYGNFMILEHENLLDNGTKIYTVYAHLNVFYANRGEEVSKGDIIAASGNTGGSRIPHLHFEIRIGENDKRNCVDPLDLLPYRDFSNLKDKLTLEEGFPQSSIELYDSILKYSWDFDVKVRAIKDIVVENLVLVIPKGTELFLVQRKGDDATVEYGGYWVKCSVNSLEYVY